MVSKRLTRRGGGKIRYPWSKWLRRRSNLTVVRGVDYFCQPHSMAQQFRNAAARDGVSIGVFIEGGTLTVVHHGRLGD
jgi:hypothetical protein